MPYLFLMGAVLSNATARIVNAIFARKNQDKSDGGVGFYNLIYAAFACLSWLVIFLCAPSFDGGVVRYAIGFGVFYVLGTLGYMSALKTGPVMLTALFVSLSLIGVTVWGFFFWDTHFTWLVGLGLVLVATSIFLCLHKGEQDKNKDNPHKISLKWLFFVVMAFVGNAGCTIVQRNQQTAYNGAHGNALMVIGTGFAAIVFLVKYLCGNHSEFKTILKSTGYMPMLSGVFNFALNLFVILMATTALSPSLIYPVMSVGSLALVTVASLFLFKEKMKWWQWLGVALGAAAVAILSL
jgi:drug/metabolite transporter (DMT)-like permease